MLEMMGVPYVGHDPLAATLLDNKHAFKRTALAAGIPTPPFTTWHAVRGRFRPDLNSRFKLAFRGYEGPFVVKPVSGRASLHVHVVATVGELPDAVDEVYRATENAVLIEQFMGGREFCIAVSGPVTAPGGRLQRGARPFAFAALERVLSDDEKIFTSMDHKPITNDRLKPVDAALDEELLDGMRRLAHETYLEFNLSSLIRLDLRADEEGNLFILEANPKPDLKRPAAGVTSLVGAGLPETGMQYDDLILALFADRLDFLFTHRRGVVQHLFELMDTPSLFDLMQPERAGTEAPMQGASGKGAGEMPELIGDIADLNVVALNTVLRAAQPHAEAENADGALRRSRAAGGGAS
jgi:D-alanine-D-alanine ligase